MTYPPPYEQQPGAQPPSSAPPTSPYPTYLGAPTPPPRRRSNGPILAVVIVLAVLLAGGTVTMCALLGQTPDPGTTATDNTPDPETPQATQTTPDTEPTKDDNGNGSGAKVVYEVTGEGPVSIVYLKEDGITPERANDTDLPWRKQLTLSDDAALVTVTAIRSGGGDGSIQCRITIDGEEVAKKSASGTFATATCTKLIL
jgi:hypothetical protein